MGFHYGQSSGSNALDRYVPTPLIGVSRPGTQCCKSCDNVPLHELDDGGQDGPGEVSARVVGELAAENVQGGAVAVVPIIHEPELPSSERGRVKRSRVEEQANASQVTRLSEARIAPDVQCN